MEKCSLMFTNSCKMCNINDINTIFHDIWKTVTEFKITARAGCSG